MKHVLGDQNFKELIDEIKQGKIEKIKVKRIALEMKGSVHGVFEEKEGQGELSDLMCLMLDRWYDEVLCDVDDGFLAKKYNSKVLFFFLYFDRNTVKFSVKVSK